MSTADVGQLRRDARVLEMEIKILKLASATSLGETCSQNGAPGSPGVCRGRCSGRGDLLGADGLDLGLLRRLRRRASNRDLEQAYLMAAIHDVHAASCGTYGHRRVQAELTMDRRLKVSHGRVERLMCSSGLQGLHRWRLRGCTGRDQAATPSAKLVERNLRSADPHRLYVADVTQHSTGEGWPYFAGVIDCFSRRVVGWPIADHIRSELVIDALPMAIWNR